MDELLATFWNLDADKVAEQHPPCAVEVAHNAHRMSVGCKVGLHLAILICGRESRRDAELFGDRFVWKFKQVVDHTVMVWSFAFGSRFLK